jgi:hypothetical protein
VFNLRDIDLRTIFQEQLWCKMRLACTGGYLKYVNISSGNGEDIENFVKE